jgi:aerobic carbon-monoxide dehydrogenase medium subunit
MYSFDYQRPGSQAEAVRAAQGEARYLAGGQSLVQAMKLRLASPERMVDLGGLAELRGIKEEGGNLVIGAMCTHAAVASSAEVRRAIPALAELAEGIGDPMVRNMGTLGGSIANADPAADYPAALVGLGATVQTDRRSIAAEAFFTGLYETALEPGELVISVSFPKPQRAAYSKLRQPASRFALVGVFVCQGANGVRVAVTGAGSSVFRQKAMEDALAKNFAPESLAQVSVPTDNLNGDIHGSATYRAAMIKLMAQKAVASAAARAGEKK